MRSRLFPYPPSIDLDCLEDVHGRHRRDHSMLLLFPTHPPNGRMLLPVLLRHSDARRFSYFLGCRTFATIAYLLINPAAGSTLFPADPFVITRIQIACVDEKGPVVVMSGVLRFEIFRMTRSITHVTQVLHETNFWATRNPAHSIWRGRVARVADESGAAASKSPPECSWPPPSPAK